MTGPSLTHSVHRVLIPIIYRYLTNESKLCDLKQPTMICQSPSQWVRNWGRAHLGRWLRVSCGFSPVMAGIRTAGGWSKGWLTRHISLSPLLPSPPPPSLHHPFLLSLPSLPHPSPAPFLSSQGFMWSLQVGCFGLPPNTAASWQLKASRASSPVNGVKAASAFMPQPWKSCSNTSATFSWLQDGNRLCHMSPLGSSH